MTGLKCAFCEQPVSPEAAGTYKRVTGWVEIRRGGGGHAVRLPTAPTAFAHKFCIERAVRGYIEQPEFFEEGV